MSAYETFMVIGGYLAILAVVVLTITIFATAIRLTLWEKEHLNIIKDWVDQIERGYRRER